MEEKVLVPPAEAARKEWLPIAGRLRLEHGAIASLLVPRPTPAVIATLRSVLDAHNHLEEDRGGLYDLCEVGIEHREGDLRLGRNGTLGDDVPADTDDLLAFSDAERREQGEVSAASRERGDSPQLVGQ